MKRFKELVRETAVEPDMPSAAARTYKEKPNKEPMAKLKEGRLSQRHPLEGHEYHKKSNEALIHIAKDAHKAAEAMKGHNTDAENKYRDQANDSATVRYFRKKSGMPDWYKKKYGHVKEETDTTEKVEMVQSQLHFIKYACEEILEYIDDGGEVEEWYQVKVAKSFSEFESLHAFIEGESRRTGMKEEVELDESVKIVDRDSDLDQEHFKLHVNGKPEHFVHHNYENSHASDSKEDIHYQVKNQLKHLSPQHQKAVTNSVHASYRIKEEAEQIDELSNELLGRYKDKAVVSHGEAEKAKNYKLSDKRFSGVVKATNKQFANFRKKPFKFGEEVELDEGSVKSQNKQKKNEYVSKIIQKKLHPSVLPSLEYGRRELKKEETEQLDEISAETKTSYTQKATKDIEQLKPHAEKGEYKDMAKNIIKKREKGIAMAKEEKEQIEESIKTVYHNFMAKRAGKKADHAYDMGDEKDFQKHVDDAEYHRVKAGGRPTRINTNPDAKMLTTRAPRNEEVEQIQEKEGPPFDPDPLKKQQVVPGKHGEAYSRVRHIARQALKKQVEKMKPVKESLEESRKAEIVKEIIKKKKNEKNDTETFQKEPVLSSEITKA